LRERPVHCHANRDRDRGEAAVKVHHTVTPTTRFATGVRCSESHVPREIIEHKPRGGKSTNAICAPRAIIIRGLVRKDQADVRIALTPAIH